MNAPATVATLPTTAPARQQFNLTPQTVDDAIKFADLLCRSSLVPKDYQGNAGNIIVAMQWGMELGLQPLQAMQSIAVINGRPSIFGDAMIALVKGSGLLEAMREDISDNEATCHVKRRGEAEQSRTFTVEDAKKAGLWGKQGPWQQYPKRMLQMRARSWALRDIFPDVLRGVYLAEEAQDIAREKDVTAEGSSEIQAPISRTEQVKRKLAHARTASLDDVLAGIAAAMDDAALAEMGALAKKLESSADRDAARAAYKARKAELHKVDAETGETQAPVMTYAAVRDRLENAKTPDDFALAQDMIRSVADEAQRNELAELAKLLADKPE